MLQSTVKAWAIDPVQVAFVLGGLSLVGVLLWQRFSNRLGKFPLLDVGISDHRGREIEFQKNAKEWYRRGHQQFKSAIFRITTLDKDHIVLPAKYLEELRQQPDDVLSMEKAFYETLELRHSKLETANPLINHTVRADLTPNLTRVNPRIVEEARRAVETEFPPCDDWTPVTVNSRLLRVVAIVSGHVFLGPDLCRREEYIHSSINYTVDIFTGIRALKKWRRGLRWLGRYFTPEFDQIEQHKQKAKQFLAPVIRERQEALARGEEGPDDMLQWMILKAPRFPQMSLEDICVSQLTLSLAAIHTTTQTVTNIIYDLVMQPEVIPKLRKEILSVLAEHDGIFTVQALYQMKLLDSVMKESQRLNPLGFARFTRVVMKPFTLKDGTVLPADSIIEVAHHGIVRDASLFPDPDRFVPDRYLRMREAGEQHVNRHQFVTVTRENLSFGWGRHACPGRFFAANEIKLILANLLLRFDMSVSDEVRAKGRYANIEVGNASLPDVSREVLFKRAEA